VFTEKGRVLGEFEGGRGGGGFLGGGRREGGVRGGKRCRGGGGACRPRKDVSPGLRGEGVDPGAAEGWQKRCNLPTVKKINFGSYYLRERRSSATLQGCQVR